MLKYIYVLNGSVNKSRGLTWRRDPRPISLSLQPDCVVGVPPKPNSRDSHLLLSLPLSPLSFSPLPLSYSSSEKVTTFTIVIPTADEYAQRLVKDPNDVGIVAGLVIGIPLAVSRFHTLSLSHVHALPLSLTRLSTRSS